MAQFTDEVQLSDEYRALVTQEVNKALAAAQAPGTQPTAQTTPEGYKVNLWGQEQTFKDSAELQDFLEKFMQNAMESVKPAPQAAAQPQAQNPSRPRVEVEKYVELLAKDPLEAERYKNLQVYGVEDPIMLVASQVAQLKQSQQQTYLHSVAEQFKKLTPDFPVDDPQAGIALSSAAQRLNIPMTAEGLQATWNHLKATQGYVPKGQQGIPQGGDMQFGNRQGIPHLSGGVSSGYDPIFDRFANLPLDQMEKALENISRGGS